MHLNKLVLSVSFFLLVNLSFGQFKGKAKHLPGTWVYAHGSGYEVWEANQDGMVGAGYRTNKIGDTVRVETLALKLVSNNLYYTLEAGMNTYPNYNGYSKHQFISKKRKLDFTNTEAKMPKRLTYNFGFFNKNKMIITIYMNDSVKKTKLILRRKI